MDLKMKKTTLWMLKKMSLSMVVDKLSMFLIAGIVLASCSIDDNPSSDNDTSQFCFKVNGLSYSIDPTTTDTLDLLSLSTEFDAQISVSNPEKYDWISVNGITLKNGSGAVPVESQRSQPGKWR